jgi:hypothetical protein
MTRTGPYDEAFYAPFTESSAASARVIVPEIVALLNPASVVDVGCGEGVWLAVFHEHGVERTVGIDGDHVKKDRLHIPPSSFLVRDLSKAFAIPETFSLVVSLEVAEHLPKGCAETFVNSLTALGKAVLFSAAVPYQAGIHHVNLQWQDYWADLFAARGFVAVDAIRPIVWRNESVSFFYRQNMLLFVEENHLRAHPAVVQAWERTRHAPLSIAHPQLVDHLGRGVSSEQLDTLYLGQVIPRLPRMVIRAVASRLSGLGGRRARRTNGNHRAD